MSNINEIIITALGQLEDTGDIVITTSSPEPIAEKLIGNIGSCLGTLLNGEEYRAVTNSLNVLVNGVKVDDKDFQTIIGLDKRDMEKVLDKLVKHMPPL
ncbi:hypothetical protein L1D59_19800 [Pseudoalteromonas piscicida]|uniref:hypothetical protein n=1 Tax=Pseudoalteromonas piscicida TaxID=43662 RepID=UPI001EFC5788|nr:hypothetical protein [Pseudoalteromonas piscicida]MCG9770845.1 hypothetical protein [Pseudoalteromonas piscicida]